MYILFLLLKNKYAYNTCNGIKTAFLKLLMEILRYIDLKYRVFTNCPSMSV